jgi:hypothetical protein
MIIILKPKMSTKNMNKQQYKIENTICGVDYDVMKGDILEFVRFEDQNCESTNKFNNDNDTFWRDAVLRLIKCDSEPNIIGEIGSFIIDTDTGELVSL